MTVTSAPAARAASAATRISFLLNEPSRVLPAKARSLTVTGVGIARLLVVTFDNGIKGRERPGFDSLTFQDAGGVWIADSLKEAPMKTRVTVLLTAASFLMLGSVCLGQGGA